MSGRADLIAAAFLAGGVHLAALAAVPMPSSGGGSGDAGQARVTVEAATPALSALVEAWRSPPEAVTSISAPLPPTGDISPDRPAEDRAIARPSRPAAVLRPTVTRTPAPPSQAVVGLPVPQVSSDAPMPAPAILPPERLDAPVLARPDADRLTLKTDPPRPADSAPRAAPYPRARPVMAAVAKRATGQGSGGTTGIAAAPGVSAKAEAAARAAWAAQIQQRIARHQVYPRGGREQGRVRVAMVIRTTGGLVGVKIVASSGADALDRAAIDAVRRAAPFPPAPKTVDDDRVRFGQWITFRRR